MRKKKLDPRVVEFLSELPPKYRAIVGLFDFQNRTYDQVAVLMNMRVGRVVSMRRTALKRLYAMAGLSDPVRQESEAWNSSVESSLVISSTGLTLIDPAVLDGIMKEPGLLRTLDWRAFEKLLAQLLEKLGYEIELQRGTKDGGIDLFALKRDAALGPHRYLLQAKRTLNAVGVKPIREILFLRDDHRVTKSCLATTSRFTAGAWKYARAYEWWLELKDFERLQEWVKLAAEGSSLHSQVAASDGRRRR